MARSCSLIWIGSLLGVPYGVLGKRKFFALFYQNGAPDQTVLDIVIVIDERTSRRARLGRRRRAGRSAPALLAAPSAHSVRDRTVTARELPKATRSFGRLRFDGWDWRRLQGVVQCRSGGCCPLTASLCGDSLRSQVSTLRVRRPSTWVRCALAAPGVARAGAAGSRTAEARFSKHRRGSSDCRVTPCILTIVLYSSGWGDAPCGKFLHAC